MKRKRNSRVEKRNIRITIYPKTGKNAGRTISRRKKQIPRRQTGGFVSRYDVTYAGRDVVNKTGKVAPKIINEATGEINKIAQQKMDQAIRSGGAEIERVAPKIIREV